MRTGGLFPFTGEIESVTFTFGPSAGQPQILIDSQACLVGELEPHQSTWLLLPDGPSVNRVAELWRSPHVGCSNDQTAENQTIEIKIKKNHALSAW
jgi:hypothetical protein